MTSSGWVDSAGPVRGGEEIDADRLAVFLREAMPQLGEGPIRVEQFPLGYSNLTYLVRVGARELILRRPPIGVEIETAHDMGREFRVLSHLRPVFTTVPEPFAYCSDEEVLGAPFYLMERVRGVILRKEMPDEMVPGPELMSRIAGALVRTLVQLHAVDFETAGLGQLGRPTGYVRRQIEGWTRRYERARTDSGPEADRVAAWLLDALPAENAAALIHNDFKYDNLVLDAGDWSRVIAVLDWEMATLGDPLMDLGTSLAYWIQPGDPAALVRTRLSPTTLPGNPTRAELVESYAVESGRDVDNIVFYYAYGLFKVAVIVQQLHARYVAGHTNDPRFASLGDAVQALSQTAWQSIQRGRIDDLF